MKKKMMILALASFFCLSACGSNKIGMENIPIDQSGASAAVITDKSEESEMERITESEESEESEMMHMSESEASEIEKENRTIVANALGMHEDARSVRSIMSSLKTIDAGRIQTAQLTQENNEDVLDLTMEDQKKYRMYLTGSKKVDAVKDLATGEWLITSER